MKNDSERNIDSVFRLTPTQEGILYQSLLSENPESYVQQYVCTISGDLDIGNFQQAWSLAASKYAALRSLIAWRGRDQPAQVVKGAVQPSWTYEDISNSTGEDQHQWLAEFLGSDRRAGFDLETAPLMRFALLKLGSNSYRFVWTHHHIVLDGWSLNLVMTAVLDFYSSLSSGESASAEKEDPYVGYVAHLKGKEDAGAEAFWSNYLSEFSAANRINTEGTTPKSPYARSQVEQHLTLPEWLPAEMKRTSDAHEVTVDTILRAAWAIVLSRYSGDRDIVFGVTVSGRPPELQGSLDMVGLLINTVPVRVRLHDDMTGSELLTAVQQGRIAALDHEWAPLADIQTWSDVPAGQPLFDSLLVFEQVPPSAIPSDLSISLEAVEYPQRSTFPVALLVNPGEPFDLALIHDPSRVGTEAGDRLLGQFHSVLTGLVKNPNNGIRELGAIPDKQLRRTVSGSSSVDVETPASTVIEDILRVAAERPDELAVQSGTEELTYGELVSRSAVVSRWLDDQGVRSGDRVALQLDKSTEMIVAVIGTWMAGAAYVPLDPDLPDVRSQLIIEESHAKAVISQSRTAAGDLPNLVLTSGGNRPQLNHRPKETNRAPTPGDPAYVIYTSGSTGKPKGVLVTHGNLAASNAARLKYYKRPVGNFLLLSPYYFDSSVVGLFWTLATGGTLVLPDRITEQDPVAIAELIDEREITHLLTLPAVLTALLDVARPDQLESLECVIAAGEPFTAGLRSTYRQIDPTWELFNEYGPTEATVWSAVQPISELDYGDFERIPIGNSIPGVDHFILDADLMPVPLGAVGELCISGPTLSPGYVGRTDETDERFVEVDLPMVGRTRVYRTGDAARWDGSGRLDLVGRLDRQVKLSGRRIEPGEIEAVLAEHPSIAEAAVAVIGEDTRASIHAFYTVRDPAIGTEELMSMLKERLPDYQIPQRLHVLDALPTTRNGKVDYHALRSDEYLVADTTTSASAETEGQRLVIDLAGEVLGRTDLALSSNFFDLGGNSLLSMQLLARINKATGIQVSPNVVLFNSLGYLASRLDEQEAPASTTADHQLRDHPAYFEGISGPLFSIFHEPVAPSASPVLLIPPYGWEYYKTHAALRRLAGALRDSGHPVLRFDLSGMGDSFGDASDASIATWLDDISSAADHLRSATEAKSVDVVGIRLGATLGSLWAESAEGVQTVVLWDPIVSGQEHLLDLERMDQEHRERKGRENARRIDRHSLLGSDYPNDLRADIERLDLRLAPRRAGQSHVLVSSATEYERLAGSADLNLKHIPDAGDWRNVRTFDFAHLPKAIPNRIVALLGEHND